MAPRLCVVWRAAGPPWPVSGPQRFYFDRNVHCALSSGVAGTRLLRQACRRRSWCARRRPSLSALGARATSAADEARLFRRFRDAPRHLAHAIARLLADLAVSGVSFSRSRRVHRPRPQRLARVLRRVRRPSWARSAPSPRYTLEGGRAAGGERGRGARARTGVLSAVL